MPAMTTTPTNEQLTSKASKGNVKLECSNSGYTKMVRELMSLILFFATLTKETFAAMLPLNL